MPTPAQKRKLDDLYNEAEKAIAAGDKERHEHGYLSPQTKDWIDHAEQERDEHEEKIDPPNDIPTRYKAN